MPPGSDPGRGRIPGSIPEQVRRLALSPFTELPLPRSVQRFELEGAAIGINRYPTAQLAVPRSADADVAVAVAQARAIAAEHGKSTIAWWITPEHDVWAPRLEELGIVNADTPGFEAVENAMALVEAPSGGSVEGVVVRQLESFEDYRAVGAVLVACFGFPELPEEEQRARYEDYLAERDAGRSFVALVDDRIVGSAYAGCGAAGLNLFGGGVLPEARGRGVYRALLQARWEFALERGTPALTVQAGRMSRPICERVGFELVGRARVFVDELR
jgi:GNAT superfamily N-acetyltransferase